MSEAEFKMEGAQAVIRRLEALEKRVGKRITRRALSRAALIIVKAMKQAAPVGPTGNLKRSIGRKEKRSIRRRTYMQIVGPRTKFKRGGVQKSGQHGYFVEKGTDERFHKKTGKSTGKMEPTHVFEEAFESVAAYANDVLMREILAGIEETARGG
jgi:HK97 gp10 family phage protein